MKKKFIAAYGILAAVTVVAVLLAGHDNQVTPVSEGWKPTFLLRILNTNAQCRQAQYSRGSTFACESAFNREDLLIGVLLLAVVLATVGWGVYLVKLWRK